MPVPAGVSRAIQSELHPEQVLTPDAVDGPTVPLARLRVRLQDQPGALFGILKPFADVGLSLNRIESRPAHTRRWEYAFFIDVSGHVDQPEMQAALQQLGAFASTVKILGSYPVAVL
jgi:prephenate dehydratase